VGGVVPDHVEIDWQVRFSRHLSEEKAIVAGEGETPNDSPLPEAGSLIEDPLRRDLVVTAQDQDVGVADFQCPEPFVQEGLHQVSEMVVRLERHHDPVPLRTGQVPDGIGLFQGPGRSPVRGPHAEPAHRQAGSTQGRVSLEISPLFSACIRHQLQPRKASKMTNEE
jgi:hypothetical protein